MSNPKIKPHTDISTRLCKLGLPFKTIALKGNISISTLRKLRIGQAVNMNCIARLAIALDMPLEYFGEVMD